MMNALISSEEKKRAYFDRQPDDWHDAEKELNVKEDEI